MLTDILKGGFFPAIQLNKSVRKIFLDEVSKNLSLILPWHDGSEGK